MARRQPARIAPHHLHQGSPHEGRTALNPLGIAVDPGDDGIRKLQLDAFHDDSAVLPPKPSDSFRKS